MAEPLSRPRSRSVGVLPRFIRPSSVLNSLSITKSAGKCKPTSPASKKSKEATIEKIRIVVLGLGGVGKSTLTCRFLTRRFIQEYDPTLEDTYNKTQIVDGNVIHFQITDTAGTLEAATRYLFCADAFIIVYSITDRESFRQSRLLHELVRREREARQIPIVLIGNKADIETQRTITRKEGRSLACDFGSSFYEISAANGYSHITNIIYGLANTVQESRKKLQNIAKTPERRKSCSSKVIYQQQ